MNAQDDLERRLGAHYETEAPSRAPEWLLDRVLETVDATPQRRSFGDVRWGLRPARASGRLALTVAVIVVMSLVGLAVIRRPMVGPAATAAPTLAPATSPSAPGPSAGAWTPERIVAEGDLYDFATTESGAVLTLWDSCRNEFDEDCGHAWRLRSGSRPPTIGLIGLGDTHMHPFVSGTGFILIPHRDDAPPIRITQDGTVTQLDISCHDVGWSIPTEPGRLASTQGLRYVDTVTGARCETGGLGGRSLAQGVFSPAGTLWALVDNETDEAGALTIGRYDGSGWAYHDFTTPAGAWTSVLAATDSSIVVLLANPEPSPRLDRLMGLAVSRDGGATWSETVDPEILKRDLPFSAYQPTDPEAWFSGYTSMAFAGPSALYLSDGNGDLWRSTDLATFSRVELPGTVRELRAAGDAVIAQLDPGATCSGATCQLAGLIRISVDGTVERLEAG